jgi:hypothetical protein
MPGVVPGICYWNVLRPKCRNTKRTRGGYVLSVSCWIINRWIPDEPFDWGHNMPKVCQKLLARRGEAPLDTGQSSMEQPGRNKKGVQREYEERRLGGTATAVLAGLCSPSSAPASLLITKGTVVLISCGGLDCVRNHNTPSFIDQLSASYVFDPDLSGG